MITSEYYTTYIQRERHAIVDQVVTAGLEVLQIAEVVEQLGEYAVSLSAILQNVTVPNIRHNKVILGKECDAHTPIVAVHPDEVLFRNPSDMGFNALQRESLYAGFNSDFADSVLGEHERFVREVVDAARIDSLRESGVLAYVQRCAWPLDTTIGRMQFSSMPVVLLDANEPRNRTPSTLLHELTHVYQLHECPVEYPDEDSYRLLVEQELEAYHVESRLITGLQRADLSHERIQRMGVKNMSTEALFVEEVRLLHEYSEDEPFKATDRMIAAIAANGLKIT